MLDNLSRYRKAIVAVLTAGLVALQMALTDDRGVSSDEAITVALALLGALGVYLVPNDKPAAVTTFPPAHGGDSFHNVGV